MFKVFYNLVNGLYKIIILLASPFNKKAALWLEGRKDIHQKISKALQNDTSRKVWFHCASLGEFEQARPVLERFRKEYPDYKIVLTFFSPSGYEVRKNYPLADYIFYLPADSQKNALLFIETVKPSVAFFTKYDFWYYYISTLKSHHIPLIVFSAIFRPNQIFFKKIAKPYKTLLKNIDHIFLQDTASAEQLKKEGFENFSVSGDTRFDRVSEICKQKKEIPLVEAFKNGLPLLVIGSAWPEDMVHLTTFINNFEEPLKVIIAPHEIHIKQLDDLRNAIKKKVVYFSEAVDVEDSDVLIVDNIGMLSSIYYYGDFAYVGGAFGKGLHNILEAVTFGLPVFFGPNYLKFKEAKELIEMRCAFSIESESDFFDIFPTIYRDKKIQQEIAQKCLLYIEANTGSTDEIIAFTKTIVKQ